MDLETLLIKKIQLGEKLITSTSKHPNLEGLSKLQRKINQELKFLKKIHRNKTYKKEHLQCSNLTHFSALLNVLETTKDNVSVNKIFMLHERKIVVDIICENGLNWVKVVARNPKSLSQISMGDSGYGVRSILDQAKDFVECSKLHPCTFQTPKIIFTFANGVGANLGAKIESLGIQVEGQRVDDNFCDEDNLPTSFTNLSLTKDALNITKVNLDVSAMLAYVSSVTNGSAGKYKFKVPVLAQQAAWELLRPQKPILENFFKGKKLFCCETAEKSFNDIVNTVGGVEERLRAQEFMKTVTVLPDDASSTDPKDDSIFNKVQLSSDKNLPIGGKIRERSLTIFRFGDRIRAVTVTANEGFLRATKQQGINFVAFLHESRALTEQKEQLKGSI